MPADQIARDSADGWVVVTIDPLEIPPVVHVTGVHDTPEQAEIAAGKLAAEETQQREPGETPWQHVVAPMFFDGQ